MSVAFDWLLSVNWSPWVEAPIVIGSLWLGLKLMDRWFGQGLTTPAKAGKLTYMSTCTQDNCQATFYYVAERQFPTLCIDHADDASRELGWTPENSHD